MQQVDARRVGPLHVLDQQHDGERASGRLHEVARLADQPLLRRARGLPAQRTVGVGQYADGHLHADGRRVRAQQRRGQVAALAGEQPADRVDERQERLRGPVRLRAPSRRDRERPRCRPRATQELADEGALADASVAGHEDDGARPRHGRGEALLEPRQLGPATHEHLAGSVAWNLDRGARGRAQRLRHVAGGRVAIRGLLRERAPHRRVERHDVRRPDERRGVVVECRRQDGRRAVAAEGAPAAEGLVEEGARGEEVRARVDGVAEDLLGGHVARRSHDEPGRRELAARVRVEGRRLGRLVGEAEVHEPAAVRGEEEVRGLHVAVDDAGIVQRGEPLEEVEGEVERLAGRQGPAVQARRERLAGQELHDDERLAVVLSDLVDRAQVRVAHPRRRARLAQEAPPRRVVRALQHLQRDLAPQLLVLGEVHPAHAALADEADDAVAPDPAAEWRRGRGGPVARRRVGPEQPAKDVPAARAARGRRIVLGGGHVRSCTGRPMDGETGRR